MSVNRVWVVRVVVVSYCSDQAGGLSSLVLGPNSKKHCPGIEYWT